MSSYLEVVPEDLLRVILGSVRLPELEKVARKHPRLLSVFLQPTFRRYYFDRWRHLSATHRETLPQALQGLYLGDGETAVRFIHRDTVIRAIGLELYQENRPDLARLVLQNRKDKRHRILLWDTEYNCAHFYLGMFPEYEPLEIQLAYRVLYNHSHQLDVGVITEEEVLQVYLTYRSRILTQYIISGDQSYMERALNYCVGLFIQGKFQTNPTISLVETLKEFLKTSPPEEDWLSFFQRREQSLFYDRGQLFLTAYQRKLPQTLQYLLDHPSAKNGTEFMLYLSEHALSEFLHYRPTVSYSEDSIRESAISRSDGPLLRNLIQFNFLNRPDVALVIWKAAAKRIKLPEILDQLFTEGVDNYDDILLAHLGVNNFPIVKYLLTKNFPYQPYHRAFAQQKLNPSANSWLTFIPR